MAVSFNADKDLNGIWQDDGGVFSANNATSTAFDYFPDDAAVDDAVYFGSTELFKNVTLYVGTSFSANSQTFVWEYWDGSAWTALSNVGNGDAMTLSGEQIVTYDVPTDWAGGAVNSWYAFWIRCRLSAVDTPTEGGAQSTQKVQVGDFTVVVTGTTTLQDIQDANDTNNWGIIEKLTGKNFTSYVLYAYLDVGDGTTSTTFTTNNTALISPTAFQRMKDNATWNASHTIIEMTFNHEQFTTNPVGSNNIDMGSGTTSWDWVILMLGKGKIVHRFDPSFSSIVSTWTNMRIKTSSGIFDLILPSYANGDIDDFSCDYTIRFNTPSNPLVDVEAPAAAFVNGGTLQGATISGNVRFDAFGGAPTFYLKNTSYGSYSFGGSKTTTAYIQYSFDLTVQDVNGDVISGATVKIEDAEGTEVFNGTTDVNGQITQQWLNKLKAERPAGESATETTLTPHTVTISKAGYQTKVVEYNMTKARDEVETLERAKIQIDQETL